MSDPSDSAEAIAESVFHYAVEQSAIAIAITDVAARILYVNPAFSRITGYERDEVLGQSQSVLSYKTTPRSVYEAMWSELTAGRPWSGRLLNRRRDGTPYVADLTVTPVCRPGSDERCYLGMHWDATEAHRTAQQLRNHKQLVESVISVVPFAVALLDGSGRVVLDNPAYRRVAAELGVSEPASTVMAELRERLGETYTRAIAQRRALEGQELFFERPGRDPRWYACALSWFEERSTGPDALYSDVRNDYALLVMQDVTAARRQEEALRLAAMRAMLSEGELDQSLREALSGAIFQLQGPVNLISAAATLQRRRAGAAGETDPLAKALADAQRAGEAAIATLQAAMPPEPATVTAPVNLNEVLRDVLMLETDALLAAGISVDWRPTHALPPVQGEAGALRTLFRQLVTNAIEAMNERGRTERVLTVTTRASSGQVTVGISDTGPGVPEALRLKVFEPFFSTKQSRGGTRGVGLALAQEIVSRHRGVLGIDANYGTGCKLDVSFPSARAPEPVPVESYG